MTITSERDWHLAYQKLAREISQAQKDLAAYKSQWRSDASPPKSPVEAGLMESPENTDVFFRLEGLRLRKKAMLEYQAAKEHRHSVGVWVAQAKDHLNTSSGFLKEAEYLLKAAKGAMDSANDLAVAQPKSKSEPAAKGKNLPSPTGYSLEGYEGSFTQAAFNELSVALANKVVPPADVETLVKIAGRNYPAVMPQTGSKAQTGTEDYGLQFDLMEEMGSVIRTVRGMREKAFTFSGALQPGIELREAKSVADSSYKMITTLMKHMETLINIQRLQKIERAVDELVEELPDEYGKLLVRKLESKLSSK